MVMAYDLALAMPVKDLYDSLIMAMSIAAAKDMYEKGQKRLEDFNTKYGDFMSPIQKDMEWYDKNVTGRVRDTINNLYANGIDPLRSAEGRAAIALLIYSMPTGLISLLRLSAEDAKEYIKNRGKLQASGLYNPDLEERFLGYNLNNWSTVDNGIWDRISPLEAKSLKELTESSYNNRTPHDLTKDEVLSFAGQTYDPRMKYKGFTDEDLLGIANTVAPGLTGTPWNDYYRDLAAKKVAASGMKLTDKNINAQLARDIADTLQEYLIKPIGNLDDWYKQLTLSLQRLRLAIARARNNNNNPDAIGWTARLKAAVVENFKKNSQNYKNTRPSVSQNYGLFQTNPLGADKTSALAFAANVANPEQVVAGLSAKRLPISFVGNDIFLTKKRQYQYYDNIYADVRKTKLGMAMPGKLQENLQRGVVDSFNNFLKRNHINGYITSPDVTVNYTVDGDVDVFDVNTYMRVKKSDIFSHFGNNNDKFIKQGQEIGLVAVMTDGRRVEVTGKNKQKLVWDQIESVDIPITRSMSTPAYGKSQLDVYHDAFTLGKGTGAKRQNIYEDRDEDDIDIEY